MAYFAKLEKLASLQRFKASLVEKSLHHVERQERLQEWHTRVLLREEKLTLLRSAVEKRKKENEDLKLSVETAKERHAALQLRRRKHREKEARIQRFVPHSTQRRDAKLQELEGLKEGLMTWRRNRIDDLLTHIFVIDEGEGRPPLPLDPSAAAQ